MPSSSGSTASCSSSSYNQAPPPPTQQAAPRDTTDDRGDVYTPNTAGSSGGAHLQGTTETDSDGVYADPQEDPEFDVIERRARAALESIAIRETDVELHMPEYLEVLRDYRHACQARSLYNEANLVQQVLRNLRLEEESRHVRGLTEQQMDERRVLEDAHRDEFRRFHHVWNIKIDAFEEEQLEQEIALLERQNEELVAFHEEMREFNPRVLRYSRKLLHARAKQHTLARQKDYVNAQMEKEKADAIEVADMERFEETRSAMYERREYALRHRHQQELLALRMKVESRRLFLERGRKKELDVLLQRYINVRRELESQQNIVRSKTGTILLKHAHNTKTDTSGSAVLVESAVSGTFGSVIQRRYNAEDGRVSPAASTGAY